MPHLPINKRKAHSGRSYTDKRYKTARWQRQRAAFLANSPLCTCGKLANILDHIVPVRLEPSNFWNVDNWQGLCTKCHDHKSATIDKQIYSIPPHPETYRQIVKELLQEYAAGGRGGNKP